MGTALSPPKDQTDEVVDRLYEEYPDTTISLNFDTRLELLVAVILSAQCTDERVNEVTAGLFEKYDTAADYADAGQDELRGDISSITYPNQKAGWIVDACETIVEEHDGDVPDTMDAITELSGVGRKTANVVLQHGHDIVEGIAVDTHVMRLARRLGMTEETNRDKIETELMELLPEEDWQAFTHLLISHGRATCTARNPDCGDCVLEDVCPSSKLDSTVDLANDEPWET
ncbi:MAG: endonuclease III [Halobacteriales archaeon]